MKKITVVLLVLLGILTSIFVLPRLHVSPTVPSQNKTLPITTISHKVQVIENKKEVNVGLPSELSIPKLGINTSIESVGMDTEGKMDVPKNDDDVAWYNLGYKPGDKGSAVIAGHYDKVTGAPAVFYNISNLTSGDTIVVTDYQDKEYTFMVTHTETYPFDALPLQAIFNTQGTSTLNLITCEGKFNQTSSNYSHRTVVYSKLVQ